MIHPAQARGFSISVALVCLVLLAPGAGADTQQTSRGEDGEAEAAGPPAPIRIENLAQRASETGEALREIRMRVERLAPLGPIARRLEEVAGPWELESEQTLDGLRLAASLDRIGDVERVWSARSDRLGEWSAVLRRRAGVLADDLEALDDQRAFWEDVRDEERKEPLSPLLHTTIGEVLTDVETTRSHVYAQFEAVLAVQRSLVEVQRHGARVLEAADGARERVRSQLLVRESAPLWAAASRERSEGALQRIGRDWKTSVGSLETYWRENTDDFLVDLLLFGALVTGILVLRRSVARRPEMSTEAGVSVRLLRRPLSAALLVILIAYPWILPNAPLLLRWVAGVVVLVPALRLIGPILDGDARRAMYWLSGLYAVDVLRLLVSSAPLLMRLLILLETVAAIGLLMWLVRVGQVAAAETHASRASLLVMAARAGLVLLGLSLLANAVGNVTLAELVLAGTLRGAFLAVLLRGSSLVLDDLLAVLLHTRAMSRLRGVQRHQTLIRRRGRTLIGWLLAFVWLWLTLGFFQLRAPVWTALEIASSATWPVGELAFSLGDLLAFAITVWLSIWLSRFVRFVLDEDVLPRAGLPRGVPYAISAGTHYLILLFGFLLAAAAAGFDMGRLTLVIGALGVGIGIGLQDVVNNFVSGLILLFERPVKPGDAIQVGDVLGEVRRIGIRTSTVRAWNGAEVIVPNSKLASDSVVNWTLSDSQRRVEIPIGVAYGTDPERVIALLLDVARAHPAVLTEPAPSALFQAHGESSLDFELRAWTETADWMSVRSELTVAIHRALRQAAIEIPFPQRDLHLRSVAPMAGGEPGQGSRNP